MSRPYDEPDTLTNKEKIQYGLLGVVVIGGSLLLGTQLLKKVNASNEEKKTWEDGSAATYAKQIKMAFENDGWWGTDEAALRKTFRAIPSKTVFKAAVVAYEKLYNRSMLRDLKEELQSTEYNEMIAIIAAKPDTYQQGDALPLTTLQYQSWARRLKAAFDISYGPFPGTDEDAIKAVFMEIPTKAAFKKVQQAYQQEYAKNLLTDLKSELEFWEYAPMMKIIDAKPTM
jgi:hypothetical protein